jgi:PAS domain S-box-containing protein
MKQGEGSRLRSDNAEKDSAEKDTSGPRVDAVWSSTEQQFRTLIDTLAAERSRLAAVIDNVPVGLVFADLTGRITGGNKQAESIFKHPVLLSKDLDAYAEWVSFHPDGRRVEAREYPLAQTLLDGEVHTGEYHHQCGDGSRIWVTFTSAPIRDENGTMVGAVCVTLDIDAHKRAQSALLEKNAEIERQHAELETIYRTAPIGLAFFDLPDYHYRRLNERQAAFFGQTPEEIIGRTLTEMAPIEGLRELFDQVAGGEPVVNYPLEGSLINDPNNHRHWTVSYFPVYAPDGSIRGITAASLEITQQKKAEFALIQSEKLAAVGRLASSIAHEINNPLESVTNLIYLARNTDDKDEANGYLDSAEIELRRVSAIASQTLRFHKQASNPQELSVAGLLDDVVAIYQGRIANTGVIVEHDLRETSPVRCFEGEIRQVVSNLVGNALDAMTGRDKRLLLRQRDSTHWPSGERGVTLTVADTGVGMDRQTLERLFQPFYTTKGITGTGLGLWVSKEIMDRHRGALRVRSSQTPGHSGTVFTLFLPFRAPVR